jgi:hypothetical protein
LRMITLEENDIQSIRFFSNTVNIQYSIFTWLNLQEFNDSFIKTYWNLFLFVFVLAKLWVHVLTVQTLFFDMDLFL